jgi:uncharacterized protein (DUF58 family)
MLEKEERLPTVFVIRPFQFLFGLILFIALINNQREFIILALLLLITINGAKLWGKLSFLKIKCYSTINKSRVFPEEKFRLNTDIENSKFIPVGFRITIPVDESLYTSNETTLTQQGGLLSYQKISLQSELIPKRRGWHQIAPPRLLIGDLLGFFQQEKQVMPTHHIIFYPKLRPLKPFSLPQKELFGIPGQKSPVNDPIYIIGTRDYQQSLPAKYIHWKATARHSRLQEKVCEPTVQVKSLLVVDVDRFAVNKAADHFEEILEIAASLAVQMDQQGYPIGLVTNGHLAGEGSSIIPISRNPQQVQCILEALARLQMKQTNDIVDILHNGLNLPWGVSCVYLSYKKDDKTARVNDFFLQHKIPWASIVSQPGSDFKESKYNFQCRTYYPEELSIDG